ncbi:MAG: flagellar assembly protein T N-terminal domain-containing protein [Psychromonas sp.]
MNKTSKHILIISALMVMSFNLQAQWFSSDGQAAIISGEIDTSRDNAISNALLSIMYKAGTSIESIQVVKSGVLKVNELTIKTNGEIHDMRLISERVADGIIHVNIQADLYPFSLCPQEKYAKTMFVGPFHLKTRKHAQLGGIFHSDEAISQRLYYQLKRDAKKIDPRYVMTQQIAFTKDTHHNIELQVLEVARQIASKYDVQYLLFGTIEDMSDYYETTSSLLTLRTRHKRNFQMNIYLVDGINNVTLFQKNYAAVSDWPYDMTLKFDVKSSAFWETDYGKIIDDNIDQAINDVQQALYCQPTMATIIAQYDDQVIINIGHRNNVKKGDQFQLIRRRYVTHQSSLLQGPVFIPDDILLTVVSLQSDRAILKPSNPTDMNNIQIRDMLTPVDEYTLQRLMKEKKDKTNNTIEKRS